MNSEAIHEPLGEITTLWSEFRRAHDAGAAAERAAALEALCRRYDAPVRGYLSGLLRDPHAADDLAQEFFRAFLAGAFRNANPEVGSFRAYLMTALRREVGRYWRDQARRRTASLDDFTIAARDLDAAERGWVEAECKALIHGTFQALDARNPPAGAALRLRKNHPDLSMLQLAERLSRQLGKPINSAGFRQILHRARELFEDLLVGQVKQTLLTPTREALEQELGAFGLLERCRGALRRMKAE